MRLPLPRMHLLLGSLRRVYAVLPASFRQSIWQTFFLMTLLGFAELGSIMALTFFFTLLSAPSLVSASSTAQKLAAHWPFLTSVLADPRRIILWGCLLPISLIVLKNGLQALVAWRSALLGERVAAWVGTTIMERYLSMPYAWHLSGQGGKALVAMQRRMSLGQMLLQLLTASSNLMTVALLFAGLLVYAPGVTISVAAFMLVTSLLIYRLLRKRIDRAGSLAAKAQEQESVATGTAIGGLRDIIIYQQQPVFLEEIKKGIEHGMKPRSFLGMSPAIPAWTLESGGFFLIWLSVFLLVCVQDASQAVIASTVALLALTAWRVLPSLNRVVGATVCIRGLESQALPCLAYLESLKTATRATHLSVAPEPGFAVRREIAFDHVSYRYPDTSEDALRDISCHIPVGATIGLVGRSGSGKSTLINLLSGLLEPTSGQMLVDGQPLTPARLTAYRRQIGYVPQNPALLPGSVAANIAFCEWGKDIDLQRAKAACQDAAIDFLGPDFADMARVHESALSGGQAQRVSIARALYGQPGLLIFDEATSALDQGAEGLVQKAMKKSLKKRTSVIAAHRLETLEMCDAIFWLEGGRLIRQGDATTMLHDYADSLKETVNAHE